MLNISIKKIRLFLWSGLVVLVAFLLWQGVVPTGEITYSTELKEKNDFIGKLSPESRVKGQDKIIGNPIYFSLRPPRNFRTAKTTLVYKNRDLPVVEAGMLVDGELWRYQTQPLENKKLEKLTRQWHNFSTNGIIFLQKEKNFSSLEEFRKDPPPRNQIAVYNYDWDKKFLLPEYSPTTSKRVLKTDLVGEHQILTYIKEEKLDWEFSFRDRNQNKDSDPVEVRLYAGEELLASRHLSDDGVSEDTGEVSRTRSINLEASDLPEGVYRIEIRANDDMIIEEIKTSQKKLSFRGQLRLAGTGISEQRIYTTGEEISAKIWDPAYLQTLDIKNKEKETALDITETYKRFSTNREFCSPCSLSLEKGGVSLFSDGVFSFRENSLLDTSLEKVDAGFDPQKQDIKYILARYTPPQKEGDWKRATAEFDLTGGYKEEGKYNFMISVPGLKAEDGTEDFIEIKKIEVKLRGRSLWEKIVNSK